MIIEIPFKTPTINHLYGRYGSRSYLKPEAKRLRAKIADLVEEQMVDQGAHVVDLIDEELQVHIMIFERWYNKSDKKISRKDIDNRAKFLLDSVFKALGDLDDRQIFKLTIEKVQSTEDSAAIQINKCVQVLQS